MKKTLPIIFLTCVFVNAMSQSISHTSGSLPIVEGTVSHIAAGDNFTAIIGDLTKIAPYKGTAGYFDIANNSAFDEHFPLIHTKTTAVISDGNGGFYLASDKHPAYYSGGLIHINADKTIDPNFGPLIDEGVLTMTLAGNILYVGGTFTQTASGPEPRKGIAAFDATTGALLPWNPNVNGSVRAIEVLDNVIYIGGKFNTVGGEPRAHLAAVDATTGVVLPWNPGISGTGNPRVHDLLLSDDVIYVGGVFYTTGGQSRNSLAAISLNDGQATAWNPAPEGGSVINTLAKNETSLFFGGNFTRVGGQFRQHIANASLETGTVEGFKPNFEEPEIRALQIHGTTLHVAGSFNNVNGTAVRGMVAFNINNSTTTSGGGLIGAPATCFALSGDIAFVGSDQQIWYNDVDPIGIAIVDNITGELIVQDFYYDGTIESMIIAYDVLYVAGTFTQLNGESRNGVGALDLRTNQLLPWSPTVNGAVHALETKGTTIYLGGSFNSVNGEQRKGFAAVHIITGNLQPFVADIDDGMIRALNIYDERLYLGGTFTSIQGTPRLGLAALDVATSELSSWYLDSEELTDIYKIRSSANRVAVGDENAGIQTFNAHTGELTQYTLNTDGPILDFEVVQELLIIGGRFTSMDGLPFSGLASIDMTTATVTSWVPEVWQDSMGDPAVLTLSVNANRIFIGGGFQSIGFELRSGLGSYNVYADCQEPGQIEVNGNILSAPDGDFYQWFQNNEPLDGANEQALEFDASLTNIYTVFVERLTCPNAWVTYEHTGVTSIEQNLSGIHIFPNPFRNTISIIGSNGQVKSLILKNAAGLQVPYKFTNDGEIDMTDIQPGCYILSIQTSRGGKSVKVIKLD